MSRDAVTTVGTAAGTGAAAAFDNAAWKKAEREDWAGDGGVCDGNSGDGTGGRIALMPTGLMKTIGNGLTPAPRGG